MVKLLIPKIIALVSPPSLEYSSNCLYDSLCKTGNEKRFDKEMKPILYFKSYRSFCLYGIRVLALLLIS